MESEESANMESKESTNKSTELNESNGSGNNFDFHNDQNYSNTTTFFSNSTESSSNSNISSNNSRSSKTMITLLIYNAIIQNNVNALDPLLRENPDYFLNEPMNINDEYEKFESNEKTEKSENDINEKKDKNEKRENNESNQKNQRKENNSKTPLMIAASLDYNQGETALFQASAAGNAEIVKILLKNQEVSVNLSNKNQISPLIVAAYHGHSYVCRLLLDRGKAIINQQDDEEKSALSYAATEGHGQVVETLLGRGADTNLYNWSPLMLAAYVGRANIVRQLLMAGADSSIKTVSGKTAANLARDEKSIGLKNSRNSRYSRELTSRYRSNDWGVNNWRASSMRDSRRVSTSSRLKMEMVPREENDLWVYISWIVTAPFLDKLLKRFGGMEEKRVRQAWREKFTLCIILILVAVSIALFTLELSNLACKDFTPIPESKLEDVKGKVMIVRGKIYNVEDYFNLGLHKPIFSNTSPDELNPIIKSLLGKDVSNFFPLDNSEIGCNFIPLNQTDEILCPQLLQNNSLYHYSSNTDYWIGGDDGIKIKFWIESLIGTDATKEISRSHKYDNVTSCFEHFRVGQVDGIQYGCFSVNSLLSFVTVVSFLIGIMKLLSTIVYLYFMTKQLTKDNDDNKINNNREESLKRSFDSLAGTDYSDQHKIFFIVADGDVTGSGESKSTPEILKDLIVPFDINGSDESEMGELVEVQDDGVRDGEVQNNNRVQNTGVHESGTHKKWKEPKPASYLSIGSGTKRHNMAKVYTGYYIYEDHQIPTILIIKCGTPSEIKSSAKPEFELFEKVRLMTGVTIDKYEFVCMVDADTIITSNSINELVKCMKNDSTIIGLCGETQILNKTENWVTMIQIFEYFLSHNFGKTFESIFAGVTCLPGCFCMYRIYYHNHEENLKIPILIDENIMNNYTTNDVDTLHQKNLLLLGEDRYLTNIMLRAFPKRKILYCPSAICKTTVPNSFSVLLSQRRRWINGTMHNQLELLRSFELPGRFCCSMQFVVFMDLIGSATTPLSFLLIFILIINFIQGHSVGLQLLYVSATYLIQFLSVVLISFNPIQLLWAFVFVLALPIWYFILPLYSYWHFDDFSWGTTRKLAGNVGSGHDDDHDTIFDRFDPSKIKSKKWDDWIIYRKRRNLPMFAPLPKNFIYNAIPAPQNIIKE
ncbi:6678_t:CDS:2 [Diversispora eburnea]|uniref:chitin synthase n=1 Tax=Diversispora eburnea TaxID=1213867 RepID=A0A9N8V0M4_9GLOM|nr:6678_t:CDS:2 [Diversispora eburnea]